MDYPGLRMEVDRVHAAELGLTQKEIVDNVITALNSNAMIAPNYWSDQQDRQQLLPDRSVLRERDARHSQSARSEEYSAARSESEAAHHARHGRQAGEYPKPTEVDHYQIQRTADVYVTPKSEDLGRVTNQIQNIVATIPHPANVRVNLRGMVQGMQQSFRSFAIGFSLSFVLLYLILVAQFRSFIDPVLIMLAIPMGIIGVLVILC